MYPFNDNSYIFSWLIDEKIKKINISIEAKHTDGWVGLGFSPDGAMENSDMIICYFQKTL